MSRVRVVIPAHNEAACIGAALRSVQEAIAAAEAARPERYEVVVALDRCTDDTARIALDNQGVTVVTAPSPGKVEALRAGAAGAVGPWVVILDADVVLRPDTLRALAEALDEPTAFAASPPRVPAPPRRSTPLARAIYHYNLNQGWSPSRPWLSGRCLATRTLALPDPAEVARRQAALTPDPWLDGPILADDIYLSRWVAAHHGAAALRSSGGAVTFRPPETLDEVVATWRRLSRELARMDRLYPEWPGPPRAEARVPWRDRGHAALFGVALAVAKRRVAQEAAAARAGGAVAEGWARIASSKVPL